ncbi:MAG: hypothetical protein H0X31_03315 [Nostocaceae cyanobacterium]|nr:hypothetical protein [Nostocaceae cyanobacterium]
MIEVTEVIELFLQVCPDVRPELEEYRKHWGDEPPLYYCEIDIFTSYVVDSYEKARTESFAPIFQLVERLITEGDDETQCLMIVGLLEGLQNSASWRSFGYHAFEPYLEPTSLAAWRELEVMWEGKD